MAEEKDLEEMTEEERKEHLKKVREEIEERTKEIREKAKIANEAMAEGKGKLKLEKPITAGDTEIEELVYDFNELSGLEFTEAMDSDMNAQQIFRITNKQALSLFAVAAAKQTPQLDKRDIIERIGMTDSVAATQIAILFFSASTRAGRMRISKK